MARIVLEPSPKTHGDFLNNCNSMFTEVYADITVNTSKLSGIDNNADVSSGLESIYEGGNSGWRLKGKDPNHHGDIGTDAVDFSSSYLASTLYGATGAYSHAEGLRVIASGPNSHAEGHLTVSSFLNSHAEGYQTEASGENSHSEGENTTASNTSCHAEGRNTVASGLYSHAEGEYTTATGQASHAEGYNTLASGFNSHAAGQGTLASGNYSTAFGSGTKAINNYSFVSGSFNVGTSNLTIVEIGTCSSDGLRAKAFEIYTDNRIFATELTIALINNSGDTSLTTKEYVDSVAGGGGSVTAFEADFDNSSLDGNFHVTFAHGLGRRPAAPPAVYDHNDNLISPMMVCTAINIRLMFGGPIDDGGMTWKVLAI